MNTFDVEIVNDDMGNMVMTGTKVERPILLEIEAGLSGLTKISLRTNEKYEVLYKEVWANGENEETSIPVYGVYLSAEEAEEFLNKFINVIGGIDEPVT